jgi:hypothetical protein
MQAEKEYPFDGLRVELGGDPNDPTDLFNSVFIFYSGKTRHSIKKYGHFESLVSSKDLTTDLSHLFVGLVQLALSIKTQTIQHAENFNA